MANNNFCRKICFEEYSGTYRRDMHVLAVAFEDAWRNNSRIDSKILLSKNAKSYQFADRFKMNLKTWRHNGNGVFLPGTGVKKPQFDGSKNKGASSITSTGFCELLTKYVEHGMSYRLCGNNLLAGVQNSVSFGHLSPQSIVRSQQHQQLMRRQFQVGGGAVVEAAPAAALCCDEDDGGGGGTGSPCAKYGGASADN
uniref:Uncharacterized protein n=1 Tax=Romanomermis culicivorax TaxID=13658 RepID=A0A915IUR2_ROMCU